MRCCTRLALPCSYGTRSARTTPAHVYTYRVIYDSGWIDASKPGLASCRSGQALLQLAEGQLRILACSHSDALSTRIELGLQQGRDGTHQMAPAPDGAHTHTPDGHLSAWTTPDHKLTLQTQTLPVRPVLTATKKSLGRTNGTSLASTETPRTFLHHSAAPLGLYEAGMLLTRHKISLAPMGRYGQSLARLSTCLQWEAFAAWKSVQSGKPSSATCIHVHTVQASGSFEAAAGGSHG